VTPARQKASSSGTSGAEGPRRPVIALTAGDPGGIGPEVIRKALSDRQLLAAATFRLYGPCWAFEGLGPQVRIVDYPSRPADFAASDGRTGGEHSFRFVEDAIGAAMLPASNPDHVDAIVTGPISKRAWHLAGHGEFPGHTELFAARFGGQAGMMFVTPRLRVILATVHVPLSEVPRMLTAERVTRTIELGHGACVRLGVASPRIAVCGLNPHAGERGLLGADEARAIEPAIRSATSRGMDVKGPFPGDTVFLSALRRDFDLVVAMYHDQGLIPVKLLDRDSAVNMTVGLPVVRTSPDHGTAFDIAGKGIADPGSMKAAIELAVRMCGQPKVAI
jgi:4-hydroxythreonine-4-phosphate dehydrogenase